MTWKTEPIVTSEALIGRFSGSFMRRSGLKVGSSPGPLGPPFHQVRDRLLRGMTPSEPPTWSTRPSGKRAIAPTSVYFRSGRRVICEDPPSSASTRTTSARSASEARMTCRDSTTSWSGMRVLAQWTAPSPMPRRLSPRVTPSPALVAFVSPTPGMNTVASMLTAKYRTMKSRVERMEMPKRVATCFSARRAAASSRSAIRGMWVGRPGLVNRSGRPPVPTTWPSSRRTAVPWPSDAATSVPGVGVSCSFIGVPICRRRKGTVAG